MTLLTACGGGTAKPAISTPTTSADSSANSSANSPVTSPPSAATAVDPGSSSGDSTVAHPATGGSVVSVQAPNTPTTFVFASVDCKALNGATLIYASDSTGNISLAVTVADGNVATVSYRNADASLDGWDLSFLTDKQSAKIVDGTGIRLDGLSGPTFATDGSALATAKLAGTLTCTAGSIAR